TRRAVTDVPVDVENMHSVGEVDPAQVQLVEQLLLVGPASDLLAVLRAVWMEGDREHDGALVHGEPELLALEDSPEAGRAAEAAGLGPAHELTISICSPSGAVVTRGGSSRGRGLVGSDRAAAWATWTALCARMTASAASLSCCGRGGPKASGWR